MTSFVASLLITLAVVALAVVSGRRGLRRVHVRAVGTVFLALLVTIVLAKRLGNSYDLAAAGTITPVHLALAKVATLAFLGPVVSGARLWRDPRWRSWHRRSVALALGLTTLALVTGTWMILAAKPL